MVGKSTLNATNEGGYQIVFTNGDDGTYVEPIGEYELITDYDYEVYPVAAYVASIGEEKFFSLADAIAAAKAGDTITFLANITEDVTVSKDVTIDGAGFTFTGKMVLSSQNGTVTIKNVKFDGKGYNGYAVETRGVYYVTIEDCTAKNYGYGFVQLASATVLTTVKNVTVTNVNYGVKVDYSGAVVLEQGETNAISCLSAKEAIPRIIPQTMYGFKKPDKAQSLLERMDCLIRHIPVCLMVNKADEECAWMSYSYMTECARERGL
jgi:hypothetical protein